MLTGLVLRNWKSFRQAPPAAATALEIAPLTLLVGPNGAGKSNALDALRFAQGAALNFPLADVLRGRYEGQREIWPPIRGGPAEAAAKGSNSFHVATLWALDNRNVTHGMTIQADDDVAVGGEWLIDSETDESYFDTHHPKEIISPRGRSAGGAIVVDARGLPGAVRPRIELPTSRSLMGQLKPTPTTDPAVFVVVEAVREALREATFLDIRPDRMRDYRPQNGGHLGTAGENISPALFALDETNRLDILEWLSELCAPEVDAFEFDVTQLREVMVMLVQKGVRTSARSASDGTLRFLGLVTALLTAKPGSLVIMEEPDAGLHPSRIRLLAELLENVTSKRQVQVIATTHSPTLLAHVSAETLANVLAFGRSPETGETICKRAGDLPHFETLRDAKDVEHLISLGWLERAL